MDTNKKDFDNFKNYFNKWADYLGLKSWYVIFKHCEIFEDSTARYSYELCSRVAKFSLGKEINIDESEDKEYVLKRAAFHECCELLLAKVNTYMFERNATPNQIEDAIHEIIRTLENTLFTFENEIFKNGE